MTKFMNAKKEYRTLKSYINTTIIRLFKNIQIIPFFSPQHKKHKKIF